MTPECPKGPEREARPDNRVRCGSCRQHETVERLTAEVERQKRQALVDRYLLRGLARRASLLRRRADRWQSRAEQEFRNRVTDTAKAMAESGQQRAEVSRLREQLAAQQLPPNASYRIGYTVAKRLREAGVPLDLAQQNFVPQIVRDVMASWRVSSPEAEVPQPDDVDALFGCDKTWKTDAPCKWFVSGQHLCCVAPLGEPTHDHHCMCGLWLWHSATAAPIVHTVLLSSDTGVMGEWQAFCSGCRQRSVGDLAHAEFWKDQHLADVLVPQEFKDYDFTNVTPGTGFFIEKDEGRPSGSEAAAPHSDGQFQQGANALLVLHGESDDTARHVHIAARVGDTVLVQLDPIFEPMEGFSADVSELRPAPPQPPPTYCQQMVPYGYEDAQECGEDVVTETERCVRHSPEDAAQAARSEATPRTWTHGAIDNPDRPDPYGSPVTVRNPNGKRWTQRGNRYYAANADPDGTGWGFWALVEHYGPLTEVPSPSLRKEGEDMADDNDAIEFTRFLGEAGRE